MFDAPRELVWKCFTDPAHMQAWWGPKGVTVIAAKMDLRPGGIFHYRMEAPTAGRCGARWSTARSSPPDRIVFLNSFSDEAGGTTHHPMAPTWPLEMLSIFTFEELPGGKTRFTVRWSPHNATEEGRKTFDTKHDSMRQGWGGTLDKLAGYLPKARRHDSGSRHIRAPAPRVFLQGL